jgi:hypothetical protein
MSVLDPVNGSNIQTGLLLSQVKSFFETKANQEGQRVLDSYATQINAVDRQTAPWQTFQTNLAQPLSQINSVISRLTSIKKQLDAMLKTLTTANRDPEGNTNATGYAVAFDGQLKSLRNAAENSFDTPNLLGKQVPAKLSFPITPDGGATQTVNGTYMGSDYTIIDSDGKTWQPDRKTNLLVKYDSFPDTPSTTKVSATTGARLDSFDADTDQIGFTINAATAAIQSVSGTVQRQGLGILDSWLYGGLATQEDRNRAQADIEAAARIVNLEVNRYQVAATSIEFQTARAQTNIDAFSKQKEALLLEQGQKLAEQQDSLNRQYDVAQKALISNINFRNNYSLFFFAQQNDSVAQRNATFFQKLVDIQT